MPITSNRRTFLMQAAALAVAGSGIKGNLSCALPPAERLNLAIIGAGGRGEANIREVDHHNIVAICDVDDERAAGAYRRYSRAERFRDYRHMFDKLHASIDGVVISTPDHTHYHPTSAALDLGKHIYLEKPLAHTVWETRRLTDRAREKGIATQLGMQRHELENVRRAVELVQSGTLGTVTEVHSWVQGKRGMPPHPRDTPAVPRTLDWDLWLGPAQERAYHTAYCPYGWRFWWDFGTGETGNWGCHILDIPFWALGLTAPERVGASGPPPHPETSPVQMSTWFDFPAAADRPALRLHWYHAEKGPDILRELQLPHQEYNTLFIGSEGMLLCGFHERKLFPEEKFKGFKAPEKSIPNSPGFWQEWLDACKGGPEASCHFGYSGPLTETVLLGNVAYRAQAEFAWDAAAITADNPEVQALVHKTYREGWEV